MSPMPAYPSATLPASFTKASTSGRMSSARHATHRDVKATPDDGTNTIPGRALNASAGSAC